MKNDTPNDMPTTTPEVKVLLPKSNFDLKGLSLSQDFTAMDGGKKHITNIAVKRPPKHDFFRVHEECKLDAMIIERKEENENYLVPAQFHTELMGEGVSKRLYYCISLTGTVFLWPVKLPNPDGTLDNWNTSAHEIAKLGKDKWVRLITNKSAGFYEFIKSELPNEARWPDLTFEEVLEKAFKGKLIDSLNHPLLKKLRGEEF